ncbi:MAG: hypothetical protein LBF38_01970 [Deltaproteobacteria bacterium]|jgi:hypothetical protein|nr:hypothetical protein [Deltaproteobacteria bacterium]
MAKVPCDVFIWPNINRFLVTFPLGLGPFGTFLRRLGAPGDLSLVSFPLRLMATGHDKSDPKKNVRPSGDFFIMAGANRDIFIGSKNKNRGIFIELKFFGRSL